MKTQLSVVIPVFNAEKTLETCVGSILSQTFREIELILVDDGSTDQSPAICDALAEQDGRISVIHKKNGGVSSARNAGIDAASCEWLTFIDSDDSIPENSFELLTNGLQENTWFSIGGFSACKGGSVVFSILPGCECSYSSADAFFDGIYRKDRSLVRAPWGKLFRKTELRFNENLRYGEDLLFITDYLASAPDCAHFAVADTPVYFYSVGSNGLGADVVSDRHIEQLFVLISLYSDSIGRLQIRLPESRRAGELYHNDLVGRFCCRILTMFATVKTNLMTAENITAIYSYMSKDKSLKLFSLRPGQVPNLILFRLGSPAFTEKVYKLTRRLKLKAIGHNPFS